MNRLARSPRQIVVDMFSAALDADRAMDPGEWATGSKAVSLGRRQLGRLRNHEGTLDGIATPMGGQSDGYDAERALQAILDDFNAGELSRNDALAAVRRILREILD